MKKKAQNKFDDERLPFFCSRDSARVTFRKSCPSPFSPLRPHPPRPPERRPRPHSTPWLAAIIPQTVTTTATTVGCPIVSPVACTPTPSPRMSSSIRRRHRESSSPSSPATPKVGSGRCRTVVADDSATPRRPCC